MNTLDLSLWGFYRFGALPASRPSPSLIFPSLKTFLSVSVIQLLEVIAIYDVMVQLFLTLEIELLLDTLLFLHF